MKRRMDKAFESAPFVRSRITTGDLMYFVVLALLPCAGMGIYRYGFHAALLIGISVGTALISEFVCDWIWKSRASSVMDYSGGCRDRGACNHPGQACVRRTGP